MRYKDIKIPGLYSDMVSLLLRLNREVMNMKKRHVPELLIHSSTLKKILSGKTVKLGRFILVPSAEIMKDCNRIKNERLIAKLPVK